MLKNVTDGRIHMQEKCKHARHVACGTWDMCDYDDYTCRHLHQRVEEHKGSAAAQHLREQHNKKTG